MEKKGMTSKIFLSTALLLTLGWGEAEAQKRAFTIEDVYRVQYVGAPQLSPDGKSLVYQTTRQDLQKRSSRTNLLMISTGKDGQTRQLSTDGCSYGAQWSSDGKSLYYTNYSSGKPQLYRMDLATGESVQMTDYPLGIRDALVSPDGRYLAFTADVYPDLGADGEANLARKKRKEAGPVHAHIADSLLFRHWTEYQDGRFQHIIVYDFTTEKYTDVTPGTWHSPVFSPNGGAGLFAFSPDSKEICFTSNRDSHQEASTNCDLWTLPVTGGTAKCLTKDNPAWDGQPLYSPDGRYIAYRFQTIPSYESDRFRLAIYDRETETKTVLTEKLDNWVDDFKWSSDSKDIYFLTQERGYEPLYKLNLKKRTWTPVIRQRAIQGFDFDTAGNIYYTYTTTGKPVDLYKANERKGKEQQLTFHNQALEEEVDIRPSEQMWVMGAAGDSVHVFIVKPHDFDPNKKYPLVINVHGGPQMQWMDSFRGDWQVYPGAGYVVAYPNPHGSTGYRQDFTRAISQDWGGKPYEDVIAVADALAKLPYVDKDRMGAMGWSYGGYFMNWLQGHEHPFKCLASMMGLYDLPSMWGTTEELWFPNFEMNGQPWNSTLYKKFSPSEYVQNFKTPTLIITGERDYRVSYNQSLAYFSTLQTLGIPSRLIVFDNDGHWPNSLLSMPVYYNAHLEWFHKYLGGDPAPWKTEDMINNVE